MEDMNYNNEITLSFKHQLAKVRVVLSGTQASLAQSVEVYGYTTCTNNESVPTAGSTQGWLKMKNTTYADGTECWEANVVPGTIDLANFILLNGHAVVEKDNLTDVPEVLNAAKMYTINLTVGEKITNINKDNTTISDDGYYRVSGTFNQQINITGGKPTIYLKGASINVSDGPAISITGGTPTIHVIGEGNSVSSGNNTGIAVSNGATVTIEGNSTADVLTANGGSSGSIGSGTGIGSPVGGTQGGNIIIRNLTVHATGGGNNNVSGAGIGSSTNGACGDITIEDAVIVATGGDCAAGIGMGCNYLNSTTGSIGKITITTEDEAGFLSKLKPGMAPGFSLTPQRIGKGAYNLTPTFLKAPARGKA